MHDQAAAGDTTVTLRTWGPDKTSQTLAHHHLPADATLTAEHFEQAGIEPDTTYTHPYTANA